MNASSLVQDNMVLAKMELFNVVLHEEPGMHTGHVRKTKPRFV